MSGSGQATWGRRGGNVLVLAGEEEKSVEAVHMEQVQGGRGVLHLVHGHVQVQQLDQLLGWGRERYHREKVQGRVLHLSPG